MSTSLNVYARLPSGITITIGSTASGFANVKECALGDSGTPAWAVLTRSCRRNRHTDSPRRRSSCNGTEKRVASWCAAKRAVYTTRTERRAPTRRAPTSPTTRVAAARRIAVLRRCAFWHQTAHQDASSRMSSEMAARAADGSE